MNRDTGDIPDKQSLTTVLISELAHTTLCSSSHKEVDRIIGDKLTGGGLVASALVLRCVEAD